MVENIVEWRLTPHHPYDGAEDRRHPQQRRKASAEANAAKRCEENQNDHAQTEANDHLGRCQLLRQIRELRQESNSDDGSIVDCYAKLSVRSGSWSALASRGTVGTLVLFDGAAIRWASTNALTIASARSA